ncbi:PIN domain nuclease [Candidatus Pacearchaeota archaeon]|nr:PIN domain nuclease [Candidatus Pacearchaeota archaeon]
MGIGIGTQNRKLCLDTSALIELYTDNEDIVDIVEKRDEICVTPITIFEFGKRKLPLVIIEDINKDHITLTLGYPEIILGLKIFKELVKKGDLINDNDILIGAICIANNVPLLTLNKKHFKKLERFGLKLV